jgi:hypothetical protein
MTSALKAPEARPMTWGYHVIPTRTITNSLSTTVATDGRPTP